jgi:hypothetical protein
MFIRVTLRLKIVFQHSPSILAWIDTLGHNTGGADIENIGR